MCNCMPWRCNYPIKRVSYLLHFFSSYIKFMFALHKIGHQTEAESVQTKEGDRKWARHAGWIVRGATLPPTGGPDSEDPVSDVYQQSIHGGSLAPPHNNTNAPGCPHTGNLRSLPPFHRIQTRSRCQPRAPPTLTGEEIKRKHTYRRLKRRSKRRGNKPPNTCQKLTNSLPDGFQAVKIQVSLFRLTRNTDVKFLYAAEWWIELTCLTVVDRGWR